MLAADMPPPRRLPRHAQPDRQDARKALGARLALAAEVRNRTRLELAQACGVSVLTISNWYRGDGEPGALDVVPLARVLEVEPLALLGQVDLVLERREVIAAAPELPPGFQVSPGDDGWKFDDGRGFSMHARNLDGTGWTREQAIAAAWRRWRDPEWDGATPEKKEPSP